MDHLEDLFVQFSIIPSRPSLSPTQNHHNNKAHEEIVNDSMSRPGSLAYSGESAAVVWSIVAKSDGLEVVTTFDGLVEGAPYCGWARLGISRQDV